jgi:hypothetical protein
LKRDVKYQNFVIIPALISMLGFTQIACAQSSDIQHISTDLSADSAVATTAAASTITTDDIAQKISPHFDRLKEGKEERVFFDLPRDASFRSGESLLLTIAYEPRPVGGILRMSANLIAAFSGIGNASRPIASKELAEAIDYLDLDDLAAKATDLILQLRNETSVSAGGESTQINRAN